MNNELIKRLLTSIILLPSVIYLIYFGEELFVFLIFFLLILTIYEWHNLSKNTVYEVYGIVYIFLSYLSFYMLRNLSIEIHNIDGLKFLILIIFICILTDIGGYVFGKTFRGKKLTQISPNKTYSGAIGSFLLPIIFILILLIYNFNNMYINNLLSNFSLIKLFLITISVSLVSQIGDIFISFFKRLKNIKDTGKLIPGHGGLLDRIDGMLFAIPYSYILILLIS